MSTTQTTLNATLATLSANAEYDKKHFIKATLANVSSSAIEASKASANLFKTINLAIAVNYLDEIKEVPAEDLDSLAKLL